MTKKLVVLLLVGAICLVGLTSALAQEVYSTLAEYEELTGKTIGSFQEAPMLRAKVAAGELPVLEERLPEEPLVVEPLEEIGQYGGTLKTVMVGAAGWPALSARTQALFRISPDLGLDTLAPNIAKGWDWSEDVKTLTVYLRKGLKWSDGAPFTADDILFWYEDILLNDELTPAKPLDWSPGGELVEVKKINDYTVSFQFAVPSPPIMTNLARRWNLAPHFPKHYLKQYHVKYNPKADEIAKEEGYDYWWESFNFHKTGANAQQDTNLPTLDTWVLKEIDSFGNRYYERNPYYWKVDTAGNQLPYIDEQLVTVTENEEVANLKAMAGEFSYVAKVLGLQNYPLYKKNEEEGNYRVLLGQWPRGSETAYLFNYTHKDPVLKNIFHDIRWRQAMSLAINRDEINDTLFFGEAVSRQPISLPETSFYEPGMAEHYIEYAPEKANELLDEMGLKRGKDGYRLRPDGEPLAITIEYSAGGGPKKEIHQLVSSYWEDVGIKVVVKECGRQFYRQRLNANEVDVGTWHYDQLSEFGMYRKPNAFTTPFRFGAIGYENWHNTGGEGGEEPPEYIKRLFQSVDEWRTVLPGTEEYMILGREFLTILSENLVAIGTVGIGPWPVIVKNDLRNFPEKVVIGGDWDFFGPYQAEQWFFEK